MYGSYKKPRELVWLLGMLIFLALMAEAFMGYVLPWGNMSFWGAKVIISLFGAIPWIGDTLVQWIMGDYNPADATLNRFFALHVIALPLVLLLLVVLHIAALHEVGIRTIPMALKSRRKKIAARHPARRHRFPSVLHAEGSCRRRFLPDHLRSSASSSTQPTARRLVPGKRQLHAREQSGDAGSKSKPVWYFTPFYAILRVIPSKGLGIFAMFASIVVLFLVPWLDRGPVKSIRYRGLGYKMALGVFARHTFLLFWARSAPARPASGFRSCSVPARPIPRRRRCISAGSCSAMLLRILRFPLGIHLLWIQRRPNRCRTG